MKTIIAGVVLLCIGVACAGRTYPYRSLAARAASADGNQPYWILGAPRKGGNSIQAVRVPLSASDLADDDDDQENNNFGQEGIFSIVQEDDDDDDSSDDDQSKEESYENEDDEEDSELTGNVIRIMSLGGGNRIFSNRLDELEEREIVNDDDIDDDDDDEESGETAIFLPRAALENLPNGSILTLVDDSESTGRAIRRVVRRKRGGRPKRRRRGNNQRRRRRRRRGGNRRRPNIRVIRPGRTGNGAANRRRGPNVIRL